MDHDTPESASPALASPALASPALASPVPDLFRLDGRTAIITGASSGLGVRFAEVLHAAGANLVLAARRIDRLEALAERLPGSIAIKADMAEPADCEAIADRTLDHFGQIDVLVNNAGLAAVYPPESEPIEAWRQVMAVNLDGLFQLTQHCASKWMLQNRGVVVNVASVLGHVSSGRLEQASYAASKGAVVNLTRELAVLWARRNVRVNALCPGFFQTELTDKVFESESGLRYLSQRTPMGRNGQLHELDGALLFLASDASSFVTGQSIIVDGGWAAQ